ncbi:MAG: DEAD/DEAH box helicase [archaeon]|nr:DEAD/DEAH box helicase [archaeon]
MTTNKFEDLGVSEDVLKAVRSLGWNEPTPVQSASIPAGLEGKDLFAQAQTGTGKTGAFGSIILTRIEAGGVDPAALILVPTRELAVQVSEELTNLSEYSGHVCMPVYGGVNIENQAKQLKKGVDVIVATPGRLKDLIERKILDLLTIETVVLDEADRMLDMGFEPSVNMILSKVSPERQTMMFSATMPEEVKGLVAKHMRDHEEFLVSKDEPTLDLTAQFYMMTTRDSKREELVRIIEDGHPKMMVFCRTKRKVDYLSRKMKRDRFSVDGIHGDVGQSKRERILKDFAEGDLEVLIASDVASRGLDIEGVDVVVNYDIPVDPDTYIHRIGRTGRAGKTGRAITFVTDEDIKGLNQIEKAVAKRIVELPPTVEGVYDEPVPKSARQPKASKEPKAQNEQPAPKKRQRVSEKAKAVPTVEEDDYVPVAGRTLHGRLDKEPPRKHKRAKVASKTEPAKKTKGQEEPVPAKPVKGKREKVEQGPAKEKRQRSSPRSGETRENDRKREPRPQNRNEAPAAPQTPRPQGIPRNPKPLHSYVQIERAPAPKRDTSFDKLEINIGFDDGLTLEKLIGFVIRTAGITKKDVGNVHISDKKSRVQVVRYRSQEVVDEVFGQTFNDKRVLITNLSDKRE